MMTALPVADLAGASSVRLTVPHIADGGGWSTELLVVNNSDDTETGSLQFLSPSGQSLSVSLDGQTGTQFTYSIPPRSSRRFRTAGSAGTTSTGWIEFLPSGNTRTPTVASILTERANNVTVSETTVLAAGSANAFRLYAELSGDFAAREARSAQTFVAISNAGNAPITV